MGNPWTSAQNWYDANGNVIQTTRSVPVAGGDPQEYVTVMYYDSLNRPVTQVTRAASGAWGASDWRYNALGQMCAQADANGPAAQSVARTFHTRDGLAQTLVCNALGNATLYAYDGAGRKVRQVRVLTPTSQGNARENGDWMQTHKQFAANIYPFLFTPDPAQGGGDGLITTQYEYDASGRMSALTDDNLHRTRWTYDAVGRRVSETKGIIVSAAGAETYPNTDPLEYAYNADGTLASMTKEDGVVLYYKYDIAGRRLGVYSDEARTVALQTFVADALGRTVTSCDQNTAAGALAAPVTVQRRYDSLGRTLMESLQIGGGAAVRAVETSFNSNYKWKQKYPGGRIVAQDYDHGRLETVSDVDGAGDPATPAIAQYAYQGGRVCERTMGNGVNLEVTFNEAGYPSTWIHRRASDSAVLLGFDNYYDAAGNKTMRVATHDANDTQRYAYDSDNRLTAFSRGDAAVTSGVPDLCSAPANTWASATQAQFWNLDGLGNWAQTVTKVNGQSTTVNRTADNFNAYTQVDSVSYSYDENGNLEDDTQMTYAWDKFNRLVIVADTNTNDTLVTYLYDAQNRRVREDLYDNSADPDVENAYDDWRIIAKYEYNTGTSAWVLKKQFVYGNYIDEHLIMDVNEDDDATCYILGGTVDTADSRYYYHQDTLYSVCGLTTATDSKLIEAVEYDAYGHFRVLSDANGITSIANYNNDDWQDLGQSITENPFFYTGLGCDFLIQKQDSRNRIDDLENGRFMSKDKKGYVDGPNLYQYAVSNPIVYSDFSGNIHWVEGSESHGNWIFDEDDVIWGSFKPASDDDHRLWLQEYGFATGGYLAGWPDAASAYLHYLKNSGSDFGWDGSRMIKTSWSARWEISMALMEAVDFARKTQSDSITGLQRLPSGDHLQGDGEAKIDPSDTNWNLAIGSFFIRGNGDISCSGFGLLKGASITIEMADRYNFHWNANFPQTWLEAVGLARSYNREGGSVTMNFKNLSETITISGIDQALQKGKKNY